MTLKRDMSQDGKGSVDLVVCGCVSASLLIGFLISLLINHIVSFLPDELEFTFSNATLTRFEFSPSDPNNALSYYLTLNLTITNPNIKGGVYFERFKVIVEYQHKTVVVANLAAAPFSLGPRDTTALEAVLEGNQAMEFENEKDIKKYHSEKESRVFIVDVKIALRLRNVTFSYTEEFLEPLKIDCNGLKIPLTSRNSNNATNNSSDLVFKSKTCTDVHIFSHRTYE